MNKAYCATHGGLIHGRTNLLHRKQIWRANEDIFSLAFSPHHLSNDIVGPWRSEPQGEKTLISGESILIWTRMAYKHMLRVRLETQDVNTSLSIKLTIFEKRDKFVLWWAAPINRHFKELFLYSKLCSEISFFSPKYSYKCSCLKLESENLLFLPFNITFRTAYIQRNIQQIPEICE